MYSARDGALRGNMLIRFLSADCLIVVPATTQAGLEDIRTYCMSDIKRLCKGIARRRPAYPVS